MPAFPGMELPGLAFPGPFAGAGRPRAPPGGAPCRPRCTAWILARISCETLRPLPRLEMVGALGRGFRAAFIFPKGVEEGVILAVVAPEVECVRMAGRGGSDEGEGIGEASKLSRESAGEG